MVMVFTNILMEHSIPENGFKTNNKDSDKKHGRIIS
jgi:hypothetical protein